jgi:hypothetical protein
MFEYVLTVSTDDIDGDASFCTASIILMLIASNLLLLHNVVQCMPKVPFRHFRQVLLVIFLAEGSPGPQD